MLAWLKNSVLLAHRTKAAKKGLGQVIRCLRYLGLLPFLALPIIVSPADGVPGRLARIFGEHAPMEPKLVLLGVILDQVAGAMLLILCKIQDLVNVSRVTKVF